MPSIEQAADKGFQEPVVSIRITATGGECWDAIIKQKVGFFPAPNLAIPLDTSTYTWKWRLYGIAFNGPNGETAQELKQRYRDEMKAEEAAAAVDAASAAVSVAAVTGAAAQSKGSAADTKGAAGSKGAAAAAAGIANREKRINAGVPHVNRTS